MMIKRGTLTVSDPLPLWEVTLPQGASKGRPLAAYYANGDSHDWDSWDYRDGILMVSFGVDPVAGELEYEYQVEGDDIVIGQDGNNVTITVNQYGGVVSDPTPFH